MNCPSYAEEMMANEMVGLVGRKVGMTQLFLDDGEVVPCTVVETGPCTVLQVKTDDTRDGYNAIQLGFGTQKEQRLTKAQKGHLAKTGAGAPAYVAEIRVPKETAQGFEAGQTVNTGDVFTEGDLVDVTGISKGKGFAGVMKRYNFAGFIRSHGTHEFFRHGGSIGTRLTPGHVVKGKKMPGHMGSETVTIQNLLLAKIDQERNLVFVRGSVPGPKGAFVRVRKAVKMLNR
jgi:large subunit ribosomal protein L3